MLGAAIAVVAAAACAHPGPPPGGDPDRAPPRVVSVEPERWAFVPGWEEPVVIRFDERIAERGAEDAVVVSPATSRVRVDKGRSDLRITLEDGWEPDRVYRVTVLPRISDLFANEWDRPYELIFSTGATMDPTALVGVVTDRLEGTPVTDARVEAIREGDPAPHLAVTDTAGFFAMRYLPPGRYTVRAFRDQTGDGKLDPFEPADTFGFALAERDTVVAALALLAPDSTPARVVRAEARDSLAVVVALDDAVDPLRPLEGVRARLWLLPDSTAVPVAEVLHSHEAEAASAAQKAAVAEEGQVPEGALPVDSALAEAGVDSAGAGARRAGEREVEEEEPPPGEGAGQEEAEEEEARPPLPRRELVVLPAEPLLPGTKYRVEVDGITNVNGLSGGGGEAAFETPAPPEEPADTAAPAGADTTGAAAPDGGAVKSAAPADSTGARRDGGAARTPGEAPGVPPPPDTVPPDTARRDTLAPGEVHREPPPPDTLRRDTAGVDGGRGVGGGGVGPALPWGGRRRR